MNAASTIIPTAARRRSGGFGLVELVVAVGILAVVLAVLAPVLVSSLQVNTSSRVREQAIAATNGWIDRFRGGALDFTRFVDGTTYPPGYDYGNDPTFVAAGDPDPASLNAELGTFGYRVATTRISANPLLWRVRVSTSYQQLGQGGATIDVETLVAP